MKTDELRKFLTSIEGRIDACCDASVAEILKDILFDEAKEKFGESSFDEVKNEINKLIERKFKKS